MLIILFIQEIHAHSLKKEQYLNRLIMSNKIEILTIILAYNEEQNIRRAIHSAKKISKSMSAKISKN